MSSLLPDRVFEYCGAVITIQLSGLGEQTSVGADIRMEGVLIGRLVVAGGAGFDDQCEKLSQKARALVDRLRAGSTA